MIHRSLGSVWCSRPAHALRTAGFEDTGPKVVHPGEVDADASHMIPKGAPGVPMHGYRLDPKVFDHLIHGLWHFLHADRGLIGDDAHGRAEVDFSDVLDAAWLDKEVAHLRTRGRLPSG